MKVKENPLLINQYSGSLPPMFRGFYLKGDETSSSLDQTNNNFTSTSEDNQGGEDITIEEATKETIEASENQKESSLNNSNETTETITETRIDEAESQ
jgi:hypothetical protein